MADIDKPKQQRERSPSFPFISLRTAIDRLVTFEKYFRRHPAPVGKVGLAWGMKGKSSQSDQTLAALKAFGLIEYEGSSKDRVAKLTDNGRTYLRAQQEHIKREILARAALKPKMIAKLWGVWGNDRPPDPVCLDDLAFKHKFNENTAPLFLKVYDATIGYTNLADSDKLEELVEEGRVVHGKFEGNDDSDAPELPPLKRREVKPGMKEDVYTLKEGDVVFQWPDRLSPESYEDLKDWTALLLRKIARHVTVNGAMATEYTDDEEGRQAEKHDREREG